MLLDGRDEALGIVVDAMLTLKREWLAITRAASVAFVAYFGRLPNVGERGETVDFVVWKDSIKRRVGWVQAFGLARLVRAAGVVSTTLALVSCGGPAPSENVLSSMSRIERINAKHASEQTRLSVSGQSHIMKLRRDGQLGATNRTQQNGRVVDVINAWHTTSEGDELLTSYVVYSFLADGVFTDGTVRDSAATTEVWRFSNGGGGTWCPVISGLPFSVASLQTLDATSNATAGYVDIRFLTGSADGVVGRVGFRDSKPNAASCSATSVEISPLPDASSIYTVVVNNLAPRRIDNMKLVSVDETAVPGSARRYVGVQYLYAWGGVSCVGGSTIDNGTGQCGAYTSAPLTVTPLKNGSPAGSTTFVLNRDGDRRSDLTGEVNEVTDFDARITPASTGGLNFAMAIAFRRDNGQQPRSQLLRFGKSVGAFPGDYVEPVWNDTLGPISFGYPSAPSAHAIKIDPRADVVYASYNGGQFPFNPLVCDYATSKCTDMRPFTTKDYLVLETRFASISTFASKEALDAYSFDPASVLVNAIPTELRSAPWALEIGVTSQSRDMHPGTVGLNESFATQFANSSTTGSFFGVMASQLDAFVTVDQSGALKLHALTRLDDLGIFEESTQSRSVNGGVAYCVMGIRAGDTADKVDLSACARPRLGSADGTGMSLATARDVLKGSTYLSSPLLLRYSVSPKGSVSVTYVSKSGAISRINASESGTDWTSERAWVNISSGRPADCSAVLIKPSPVAASAATGFWGSIFGKVVFHASVLLAEILGEVVGGPVLAAGAGLLVDVVLDVFADGAREKARDTRDAQWTKIYDSVQLKASCKES